MMQGSGAVNTTSGNAFATATETLTAAEVDDAPALSVAFALMV